LHLKFLPHYAIFRQRDKDGDGKLNFEEYFSGLHDHIHGYDDEHADISHIGNITVAKERFSKLDKDNDGYAIGTLIIFKKNGTLIEEFYMKSL
jgi:hypothetical protein